MYEGTHARTHNQVTFLNLYIDTLDVHIVSIDIHRTEVS